MEQYRDIMNGAGISPDKWRVVSFAFEKAGDAERFHYRIMAAGFMMFYYMFDCSGNIANVIIPNEDEQARRIQEYALALGGRKTTLDLQ